MLISFSQFWALFAYFEGTVCNIVMYLVCTHHSISKTVDLTDAKLRAYEDHSFNVRILRIPILISFEMRMMVVMVLPKKSEVLGKCSNPGRDSYSTQVEEEEISKKNWKVGKVNYTSNTSMMRMRVVMKNSQN